MRGGGLMGCGGAVRDYHNCGCWMSVLEGGGREKDG